MTVVPDSYVKPRSLRAALAQTTVIVLSFVLFTAGVAWWSPSFAVIGARTPQAAGDAGSATAPSNPAPAPPRADRSTGTTASGPVRAQPPRMPFYVATKGATTIYVLGTLHVGFASDYPPEQPFRKPILAALDASPTLALEISPDELLLSQEDVNRYGMCRSECLIDYLPDAMWKKVETRMRSNPQALKELRHTRPWLASMLIETYDTLKAGFQSEYGTEAQLQNVYLRVRGKIVGLETLNEQISTFTRLTSAQQREMLAQDLVQTPAENVADVKELHRLWRIGDADALKAWDDAKSSKLARNKALAEQVDNRVVYQRNQRFVQRMVALAAPDKPVFVAIGALHLGGARGVLELLRKRGFVVAGG
ncbi:MULTISPECIES: TraB/GumN family protein [Caballeronia]|uniref:TraB/GumN family protein n=1 Tax=Caballeronia TaxID=1827195 RepID=UPI0002387C95|nr:MULTISPECIES: TraB/GumN family protein [unclassified Caballeronia]AET90410.1 GumN family protein [Burkholderia sp. YI23]MCE4543476.1 TraB/GumN family protein [Caballeronia sp. PC1]MCE4567468.1 TraB/GumN family protein [Caballeronia sp. CLC5]BAO87672.1 GumN family protein [Burkholderia sp. RPE67]